MRSPPRPFPSVTGPGRRARWRRGVARRALSALLAATAVVLVVREVRPAPAAAVRVVVAGRAVVAGAVLEAPDLRVVAVPAGAAQPGALTTVADGVGRRVGSAMVAGETLTVTRLVPRGPAEGLPRGRVALHVVAADPASVDLLVPGDPARVYPAAGGAPLAVAARVLATDPRPERTDGLGVAAVSTRGVVVSLSAVEADAVLAGHGSLEGPVTVSVVAAPG